MKKSGLRDLFTNPNVLKLWAGQGISVFGDMITFLAIPMMVYQATGSKSALSFTVFVRVLPILLLGPFAGALVNRFDKKRIMIMSDLLRAALTVPLLIVDDKYLVSTIYIVVFMKSIIGIFFSPSLNSTTPVIVKREQLINLNSLMGMTMNTVQFVAPLCGGALVGLYGARSVLLIDFVSFLISAASIYYVSIPAAEKQEKKPVHIKLLIADILDGFKVIKGSSMLTIIMITIAVTMFGQGFIQPLWLPYVTDVLKQPMEKFTLLVSFQGLGSIIGSIMVMVLGLKGAKSLKNLFFLLSFGVGIAIFMQITTLSFNIFIVWGTLVGVFISGWSVVMQTIIQHCTTQEYMGRVNSTFMILNQGFMLLAVSGAAIFGDYLSTRTLFIMACSFWLVGCSLGGTLMKFSGEDENAITEKVPENL